MQFYEITCKATNKDFLDKFEGDEPVGRRPRELYEEIATKTDSFNEELDNPAYCFIGDIEGDIITVGILLGEKMDDSKLFETFLNYMGIEADEVTKREITLNRMCKFLQHADRWGLIEDDCDVLDRFNLAGLRKFAQISFGENMIDNCEKKDLLERAESFLAKEPLIEEIERIYVKNKRKIAGHPVHYMFQTDDTTARREMYKLVLRALYDNDRLISRRYVFIDIDEGEHLSASGLDDLYESCIMGTMVIRVNRTADEIGGDRITETREKMLIIGEIMQKYKNEVLTVVCLPQEANSMKNFLYEETGRMSFVEIRETPVPVEDAEGFLRKVAKDNGVRANKKLFAKLEEGQTYLTPELLDIFEDWYDNKLKNDVYTQYKDVASSKEKVKKTAPKGDAYTKLQSMIGLESAKEVIDNSIDYFKAQKLFKDKGMKMDQPSMHMVFTGNPGTAKTTVARLFATIMRDNNVLSQGHLVEVGRADLVGKYVGHTAPLVKAAFKKAIGGVLFIDEAYSLVDDKDGLFGDEAINTIVQEMENNRDRLIVIFAGYPDKMEKFLSKNPGLRSRIAFHVNFDDYNTDELMSIADMIADEKGLKLDSAAKKKLKTIFDEAKANTDFGNGRFVRNMIEKSRMSQASRLVKMDFDKISKSDIVTIREDDVQMPKKLNEGKKKHFGFCG